MREDLGRVKKAGEWRVDSAIFSFHHLSLGSSELSEISELSGISVTTADSAFQPRCNERCGRCRAAIAAGVGGGCQQGRAGCCAEGTPQGRPRSRCHTFILLPSAHTARPPTPAYSHSFFTHIPGLYNAVLSTHPSGQHSGRCFFSQNVSHPSARTRQMGAH